MRGSFDYCLGLHTDSNIIHKIKWYEQNGEYYAVETLCGLEVDDEPDGGWDFLATPENTLDAVVCYCANQITDKKGN